MYSTKETIVNKLKEVLPCYYEQIVDSTYSLPLITYNEKSNSDVSVSHEMGYSKVTYELKLWVNSVSDMETYSSQIDAKMRELYFSRVHSTEMSIDGSICKVMNYTGLIFEKY